MPITCLKYAWSMATIRLQVYDAGLPAYAHLLFLRKLWKEGAPPLQTRAAPLQLAGGSPVVACPLPDC